MFNIMYIMCYIVYHVYVLWYVYVYVYMYLVVFIYVFYVCMDDLLFVYGMCAKSGILLICVALYRRGELTSLIIAVTSILGFVIGNKLSKT